MEIKLLGTGCLNCKKLEANTVEAITKLGIDAEVEKVTDIVEIMSYGILSVPALVVDGEVKVSGRIPSVNEIMNLLKV
ncbi:thioredoxin family protein [Candidatus Oleimmundimicrobium sp.]|uniref:thioredoxin family protein n=1 Tax=Candidatus Oleimmundimicrobium sp. TaxID=3060597 RepID=UPI002722E2FF|nr:thioredoxin family protein [Candidatus Oleimmundimicrobium sp.]MDO8885618.1 thioredoxin family protein [Candidatus Oleimmundimicrobium sp.]